MVKIARIGQLRKIICTGFLIASCICLCSSVRASETLLSKFGPSNYGSIIHFASTPNVLYLVGEISDGDSFRFRKALRNHDIEVIALAAPGGLVNEGLLIAGMTFDNNLTTYIPRKYECVSACSFIFFAGGNSRKAQGELGVHQFSGKTEKGKSSQIQYTVSEIIGFLNEFETPPFVFERMFSEQSIYYFDDAEKAEINSISITNKQLESSFRDIENLLHEIEQEYRRAESEKKAEEIRKARELEKKLQEQRIAAELQKENESRKLEKLQQQYALTIQQRISRNWRRPVGASYVPSCEVHVQQDSVGIILDIKFGLCRGGTNSYRASIENAIYKSEPLPAPAVRELLESELRFVFRSNNSLSNVDQLLHKPVRSASEIDYVLQNNQDSMFAIYDLALTKNPLLQGKVVFELTILPSGLVASAKVLSSELEDISLEQKLVQELKKLSFPRADVPEIIVTHQINFIPY